MKIMTMRERMLGVLRGTEIDRVPFVTYNDVAAPNKDIWDVIGRDNMGIVRWSKIHQFITPHCGFQSMPITRQGLHGIKTVMYTPSGHLIQEKYFDPALGSQSISKHYIETESDYLIFRSYLEDIIVQDDDETFIKDVIDLGDDGFPMVDVGRTPFQQMWIVWASLLDLSIHMVDIPEMIGEITTLLAKIQRQVFQLLYRALERLPITYVCIPDNITAPMIGPHYFREYCLPIYQELVGMLRDKRIPVVVHMDGDLRPLWRLIGESGINGIDSFSSPPDNDTSVAQAVAMWPDMRILLNFPSSVHLARQEAVYDRAKQILDEGGHTGRIWIQISENVPPERWKVSYPAIVKAIHDFGKP